MNEPEEVSQCLQDLIDDYLGGRLDEDRTKELEELLHADAGARRHFVRYARLHTDLGLEVRARKAGERALGRIEQLDPAGRPPRPELLRRCLTPRVLGAAAGLLLALGVGWWLLAGRPTAADEPGGEPAVAWLV